MPEQAEAIRVFNWPYRAVEEALCNAVYHRSYQIHEPVTVTITPEQMEILSLPGPDRSISDDDLEKRVLVSSRYRNRRIGDFLKELKMVEGRNTGIPLIVRAMQSNGSGLPVFKTDEDRSFFRVILPIHPAFLNNQKANENDGNKEKVIAMRRSREEVRRLVLAILEQKDKLSMGELAAELGYARLNNTLRSVVKELREDGEVSYLYPDKPNSRKQKICLNKLPDEGKNTVLPPSN